MDKKVKVHPNIFENRAATKLELDKARRLARKVSKKLADMFDAKEIEKDDK